MLASSVRKLSGMTLSHCHENSYLHWAHLGQKASSTGQVLTCFLKGCPHLMGINGPYMVVVHFLVDLLKPERNHTWRIAQPWTTFSSHSAPLLGS